jgi:hypothetical protein
MEVIADQPGTVGHQAWGCLQLAVCAHCPSQHFGVEVRQPIEASKHRQFLGLLPISAA